MNAIKELKEYFTEITRLSYISRLLEWDQEVNMRKYTDVTGRAYQRQLISTLIHRRITSEKIGKLIAEAEKQKDLTLIDKALIREARREYERNTKLPEELVAEISKTASEAGQVWQKAKDTNNFKLFESLLKKTVDLQLRKAKYLDIGPDNYSSLIDEFEPGATKDWITKTFNRFRPTLIEIVKKLSNSSFKPDDSILKKKYNQDLQFKLSFEIIKKLNFDLNQGRQDLSTHPFTTTLSSMDTRITTRTKEDFLNECIFGTIHECGHALYEMGYRKDIHDTILADGCSMGIHESQSRMWENFVGRSKEFWEYFYPSFQKYFPEILKNYPMEEFYRAVNTVQPSFIRVNADEVTYGLHIILRFEIERDLIDGKIQVNELPQIWNSKMHDLLGITPANDQEGVLQDIHWSMGAIGYFPTYQLGNLYAAQIYSTILKKMPDLPDDYRKGEFSRLLTFLRENIHQYGKIYETNDLIKRISGEELNPDYYIKYIQSKFYPIYKI
ncbi:MAG: carboxypeptidase M32 [Promethearchaeota archaeon]